MSKVKFIQWGTPTSPKTFAQRWELGADDKPTGNPSQEFEALLTAYAGGVIFVTYKDAKGKNILQEIWANGVPYSVGGGGGNIIYGSVAPTESGEVIIDGDKVEGDDGYIYIYTTPESQTAYYWQGGKWVAFDIDAEHVWFPEGFSRTEAWGCITATTNNEVETSCEGYNLKQVLEKFLVKELWPTTGTTRSAVPTYTLTAGAVELSTSSVDVLRNSTQTVTATYAKPGPDTLKSSPYTPTTTSTGFTWGYKEALTDKTITAGNISKNGTTVTGTISTPSNEATIKVGLKSGSVISTTAGQFASALAKDNTQVQYTYTVPTANYVSSATQTFISGGDYADGFTVTWKDPQSTTVTSATCPAVSAYPANNKKECDESHVYTAASSTQTLPSKASHTHKTATLTYKVYQPVIFQIKNGSKWTDIASGKFYGTANTSISLGTFTQQVDGNTYGVFRFLIPSDSTIVKFLGDGKALTQGVQYKITTSTETINGNTYTVVNMTDSAAFTADAPISLTISKK